MKRQLLTTATGLVLAAALYAGAPGPAAYARLKSLAGEWEANTEMGKVHLKIELIAGGTSLVEKITGPMPAMETVFYLDGDRLMLTHYCMAGNQPRLQARAFNAETGEVDFDFLDATNLAPGGGHMHNAKFFLTGNDRLNEEWQFYENGQAKRTETFQYTRIK